jgi:hypothetical protein
MFPTRGLASGELPPDPSELFNNYFPVLTCSAPEFSARRPEGSRGMVREVRKLARNIPQYALDVCHEITSLSGAPSGSLRIIAPLSLLT